MSHAPIATPIVRADIRDGTARPRPGIGRTCNKGTMAAKSDASGGIRAFERPLEITRFTRNP
jgi:hypothetical protein